MGADHGMKDGTINSIRDDVNVLATAVILREKSSILIRIGGNAFPGIELVTTRSDAAESVSSFLICHYRLVECSILQTAGFRNERHSCFRRWLTRSLLNSAVNHTSTGGDDDLDGMNRLAFDIEPGIENAPCILADILDVEAGQPVTAPIRNRPGGT